MHRLRCSLGLLTLLLLLQELVPEGAAARVRVVKVKKTRHDKRQTAVRGGYSSSEVRGQAYDESNLKPEDNPYNAGNRKVDYPHLTPSNQKSNQFSSSNQDRNVQQQSPQFSSSQAQKRQQPPPRQQQPIRGGPKDYDRDEHCEGCGNGIPGEAGTDYPTYTAPPKTNFECKKQQWPGYYADTDARCQVFWICQKNRADAFLCPNGTLFNQQVFVCDWWFNVDCGAAAEFYSRNQYIYAGPGVDIFGNQVAINNRQSTPVAGTNIRNRSPTNRPPSSTFQQPAIDHAPPTVRTFENQRAASYQTTIPIIQTAEDNRASSSQSGSTYNRRATQTTSPKGNSFVTYVDKSSKNGNYQSNYRQSSLPEATPPKNDYRQMITSIPDVVDDDNNYRQTIEPPPNANRNDAAYNAEYDANEFLERTERRLEKSESRHGESDSRNSYANYIEAQKRLHLGSKYKEPSGGNAKSYQQNPLISSSSSTTRNYGNQQSRSYSDDSYVDNRRNHQNSQSKYSAYDSSRPSGIVESYSTTTKRNALTPAESSSDFPALGDDDVLDDIDGFKFNFAKMLLPSTTTPAPQLHKRPTSGASRRVPEQPVTIITVPEYSVAAVTTHRPFSRLIKISDFAKSSEAEEGRTTGGLLLASSSHPRPVSYVSVPSHVTEPGITTPSTQTFGKKIKSGKKRNTSNWTNYFHKNQN